MRVVRKEGTERFNDTTLRNHRNAAKFLQRKKLNNEVFNAPSGVIF